MRRETLTLNRSNQRNEKGAACQQPLSIASLVDRLDLDTWDAADLQRWTARLQGSVQEWTDRGRRHHGRR
jgi:predicted alpha/beta hydrolase family esterase